eukprot:1158665-Pelagomonas_calceolata.AAC.7
MMRWDGRKGKESNLEPALPCGWLVWGSEVICHGMDDKVALMVHVLAGTLSPPYCAIVCDKKTVTALAMESLGKGIMQRLPALITCKRWFLESHAHECLCAQGPPPTCKCCEIAGHSVASNARIESPHGAHTLQTLITLKAVTKDHKAPKGVVCMFITLTASSDVEMQECQVAECKALDQVVCVHITTKASTDVNMPELQNALQTDLKCGLPS